MLHTGPGYCEALVTDLKKLREIKNTKKSFIYIALYKTILKNRA